MKGEAKSEGNNYFKNKYFLNRRREDPIGIV
jgi:hypothetical protein